MEGVTSRSTQPFLTGPQGTRLSSDIARENLGATEDGLVENLRAENRQLREDLEKLRSQLAEAESAKDCKTAKRADSTDPAGPGPSETNGKIEFDLGKSLLKLRNIKTRDTFIDRLDVQLKGGDALVRDMLSMDSFLESGVIMSASTTGKLRTIPMEVIDIALRIPQDSATRAVETTSAESLRKEGIKDLEVFFAKGNRVTIKGSAKKLITVPFTVTGEISVTPDGKMRYDVDDMKVAGILPVPRIISSLMMSLSGDSFAGGGVRRESDSFLLDVNSFIPKNIKVALRNIRCGDGFLAVEGGPPERQENNPVTLPMK